MSKPKKVYLFNLVRPVHYYSEDRCLNQRRFTFNLVRPVHYSSEDMCLNQRRYTYLFRDLTEAFFLFNYQLKVAMESPALSATRQKLSTYTLDNSMYRFTEYVGNNSSILYLFRMRVFQFMVIVWNHWMKILKCLVKPAGLYFSVATTDVNRILVG